MHAAETGDNDGKLPNPEQTAPAPAGTRLDYLDGMRGLAALCVVFCHSCTYGGDFVNRPGVAPALQALRYTLVLGHLAVDLFIVLSGYVLMLPVARTPGGYMPKGIPDFLKRRARRIIPPYYASLAIYIFMTYVLARLTANRFHYEFVFSDWLHATPFTKTNVLLHLLLVHNWSMQYAQSLNGPTWTVATEFQIYVLFPTVLLAIWRRFGGTAVVLCGLALGLLPHFLLPQRLEIDEAACPWYIGLFAVGMVTAVTATKTTEQTRRPYGVWAAITSMSVIAFLAVGAMLWRHGTIIWLFVPDMVFAGASACLILSCHQSIIGGQSTGVGWSPLRFFTMKPMLYLGAISYSLYLIHLTALDTTVYLCYHLRYHPNAQYLAEIFFGTAASILAGVVFHLVVERRFLSSHLRIAEGRASSGLREAK